MTLHQQQRQRESNLNPHNPLFNISRWAISEHKKYYLFSDFVWYKTTEVRALKQIFIIIDIKDARKCDKMSSFLSIGSTNPEHNDAVKSHGLQLYLPVILNNIKRIMYAADPVFIRLAFATDAEVCSIFKRISLRHTFLIKSTLFYKVFLFHVHLVLFV